MFERGATSAMAATAALAWIASIAEAQEPKWLIDARAREAKPMPAREIKSKDGWLTAKLPAKAVSEIEKVQGSYTLELDIGADTTAYCEVVPGGVDMADIIRLTL